MGEKADVVISWYWENAETQAVREKFKRPTRFISMPAGPGTEYSKQLLNYGKTALQNLIKTKLPGVDPQRVAIMGFSEGCQGTREALKCGDAGRLDSVFAIDGIHTQWIKARSTFETGLLLPWRAIAKKAVEGGPLVVISTSDVQPTYVDTTTTSNWIWNQATGTNDIFYDKEIPDWLMGPVEPPYVNPPGSFGPGQASWKETIYSYYPLRVFRKSNGLWIVNYYNLDATGVGDHIFQAKRVSPLLYANVLADRWNTQEPEEGVLISGASAAYLEMGKPEVGQAVALPYPDKPTIENPYQEQPEEEEARSSGSTVAKIALGTAAVVAAVFVAKELMDDTSLQGDDRVEYS